MNCQDVEQLSPLWHSGEIDAGQHAEFAAHLAACSHCAEEVRSEQSSDARLCDAMSDESIRQSPAAQELQNRIRRQIAAERSRRWLLPSVAAASLAAAAILALTLSHRGTPINPAIFTDAARDHTLEVVQKGPRHWRTDPAEIAALEASQGITDADVKAVEATGYHLTRAKICHLGGKAYMHLVYAKNDREFSVYMRVKGDKPIGESESASGNLQLAAFSHGRVEAVIVTDAPRGDCEQFAHDAESAL